MKGFLFILSIIFFGLVSSGTSQASNQKTINFYYSGQNGAYQTYFSCDYAKQQAKRHLEALGGQEIWMTCFGGIQYGIPPQPLSMKIYYTQGPLENPSAYLSGRDACDFNVKLIDAILADLDHESVSKSESCWRGNSGRYSYEVNF